MTQCRPPHPHTASFTFPNQHMRGPRWLTDLIESAFLFAALPPTHERDPHQSFSCSLIGLRHAAQIPALAHAAMFRRSSVFNVLLRNEVSGVLHVVLRLWMVFKKQEDQKCLCVRIAPSVGQREKL